MYTNEPTKTTNTNTQVRFLLGKATITPSKPITIPKFELLAALIGARLVDFLRQAFLQYTIPTYLWSDSKCVLQWIQHQKILPQFVTNQVKEINQLQNIQYRYVPSQENPADIGSRGSTFKALQDSLWWTEPAWLSQEEKQWPAKSKLSTPITQEGNTLITRSRNRMKRCKMFGVKMRPL